MVNISATLLANCEAWNGRGREAYEATDSALVAAVAKFLSSEPFADGFQLPPPFRGYLWVCHL
jgi:hypothetical protein